jgi:hypothetical protein
MRRRHLVPIMAAAAGGYHPVRALGSDVVAWWDAQPEYWGSSGGMTPWTGVPAAISSWRDIVAGFNMVQGTPGAQPVHSTTSFNGAAATAWDGGDDAMTCTDAGLLAALPSGGVECEIWALAQQDALAADATGRTIFAYGAGSVNRRSIGRVVATAVNRHQISGGDGTNNNAFNGTTLGDFSTRHVVRGVFGAADLTQHLDGVAQANPIAAPPLATINTRARIGSLTNAAPSGFWQGSIAAILVTRPLNADKAAGLHAWLMSRRRV